MGFILVLQLFQAAFSGYNLYLCYISITNLMKYEEKSKKAAEWSQTAADQLYKTRVTQASGAGAIFCTFVTCNALMYYGGTGTRLALAVLNAGILFAAHEHVAAFWRSKVKLPLPGVGKYNEAIGMTNSVRLNMLPLGVSWIAYAILALVLR